MTFSQDAWAAVEPWFARIRRHPFVDGLADGSLPHDVFTRYLVDDAHYLDRYARVLARLAARAPDTAGVAVWAGSAVGAVEAERGLHREHLVPLGLDPDADGAPEPSPTCVAYTGYLAELAAGAPLPVALAGVLPCFRVYAEVGHDLVARRGPGDHPYGAWIDAYASPKFDAAVTSAEAYVDAVADDAVAMHRAYARATRFEWMFWDAAWRGEAWPAP